MKAGLMEIADLFVVNKSDRPEADKLVKELINLVNDVHGDWMIPVLKTQALFDKGVDELFSQIQKYRQFAMTKGTLEKKRAAFLKEEVIEIVVNRLLGQIRSEMSTEAGKKILNAVLQKTKTPYDAADKFLKSNK
jgi:LAO/AO transport system kinase